MQKACPYSFDQPRRIIGWLNSISADDLKEAGIVAEDAERIVGLQRDISSESYFERLQSRHTVVISVSKSTARFLRTGDTVIFRARPDKGKRKFDVYTVEGRLLGSYKLLKNKLPKWLASPHLIHTTVSDISEDDSDNLSVKLETRQLAT